MSDVAAAQLAAECLRVYLLATLPAQVTAKNLLRAAKLETSQAGPWTIPAAGSISLTLDGLVFTPCALTAGSRTAAQLSSEINTAMGATIATALADGRMRWTSTTTPTGPSTNSIIGLETDATGAALALGFDPGGELVVRAPLIAPTGKGIMDGEPQESGVDPYAVGRMLVVIGDRGDVVFQSARRDERLATMALVVYVPLAAQNSHASREEIQSAVACISNALGATSGRQFARSQENDVGFTEIKSVKVSGRSWRVKNDVNVLMDFAELIVTARVFQRPTL